MVLPASTAGCLCTLQRSLSDRSASNRQMADLDLIVLGVGAGSTAVYHREPSSAFIVSKSGKPLLLLDAGFGAVAACIQHAGSIPDHVYVSHNHSDHAAELPVLLAVERQRGRRLHVYAEAGVMQRLQQHRMHELSSTGLSLDSFATWHALQEGQRVPVTEQLSIQPVPVQHAERCFGLLVFHDGRPLLGWTVGATATERSDQADSGFSEPLYRQLSMCPLVLVDARAKGSSEHAGWQEVLDAGRSGVFNIARVVVHGYGSLAERPAHHGLEGQPDGKAQAAADSLSDNGPSCTVELAHPGQVLMLSESCPGVRSLTAVVGAPGDVVRTNHPAGSELSRLR